MNSTFAARIAAVAVVLLTAAVTASEVSAISAHPYLLTTRAGVELARQRARQETWAREAVGRLRKHADALEKEQLPVFEKDWWIEASKKRWQDIYPEINNHTNFAVAGPFIRSLDAAMAYAITENPRYARTVRKVLLHYCDYDFFAEHPDVGLNWSVWCTRGLMAYDLVYDTIPEADRAKIDDFFRRAMEAVMKDDQWWLRENPGGLFNNHFAWHKFMIGSYGLFYDKPELVDYAINADQGMRALIEHGTRDDGLWFESSINYHFTAVIAMVEFARQLANAAYPLNLWHHHFANGRSLEQLFRAPINTLFPDETIPTIGDTYGKRLKLGTIASYFAAYDAYEDPAMGWILRTQSRPADALFLRHLPPEFLTPPDMRTRVWPEHGYVALRTQEGENYWSGTGYSVFLSYDFDGIHSHRDKFDLIAFGRGAHIAIDPEALSAAKHAFSSQIQGELNRSTVSHNTVMVDSKEHGLIGSKLELAGFVNGAHAKMATIADRQGMVYPGVRMMRTVAATPDYIVDLFQLASDEEHTYDYLYHACDDKGMFGTVGQYEPMDLGANPPWKWLRNARRRTENGAWSVTSQQGKLTTRLTMLGEPGTQVIVCDFPSKEDLSSPPYPMLMARRKAKTTVFAAVLQSERADLPDTKVTISEELHGYLRVSVTCSGKTREFSVARLR